VVAISAGADANVLIQLVRAGVKEFLTAPFQIPAVFESLARIEELVAKRPAAPPQMGNVYTFLPSKPGVGTSTVAVNAAVAMARLTKAPNRTLLLDMDLSSGIVGFLLKITNLHSILEAAENAHHLDEALWERLITKRSGLDVLHSGRLNPDYRINSQQVHTLTEFARRLYTSVCVDVSGNLERYSLEMMQESKQIFLVVTPEIPSLHLAREKLTFLQQLELHDRVSVLLNRSHRRAVIGTSQIEGLLGVPVYMAFPNDYQGVHRALQAGKAVEPDSDLGKQFATFAARTLGTKEDKSRNEKAKNESKRRLAEYFSILPGRG
jgi:pilus assembly protein CpaE